MTENVNSPSTASEETLVEVSATETAPTTEQPEAPTTVLEVEFGRVDSEGTVWVTDDGVERSVGSYPDGLPEDPFALYVRRYLDLAATIDLFEARLPSLPAKDIEVTLKTLNEQLVEPAVVGDVPLLRTRVVKLTEVSNQRKEQLRLERAAARDEALSVRTKIVEKAEAIAAQPSEKTQWKQSGARLRELLDEWRDLQRKGPRLDKSVEDPLWKRFSAARTTFDRGRRQYFAELDVRQNDARDQKEKLIAQAEQLQSSDDWRATSAAYRDLMDQWKRAGRASRKEDDELWARFRAAQQVFFDSRREHDRVVDKAFSSNLAQKETLAAEAESLLPVKDLDAARAHLREIQDKWEEVGQVPSREANRVEGRLRAVERELREAENREWRRSDPETKARAEGMLTQLQESIDQLKADLEAAKAAGDKRRAKELSDALATKEMWFNQISSAV